MAQLIIRAGRTEGQYWRDLWHYRELFYVLAWRDVAVKYKQTVIGILWAFLQPFINSVLMTIIFSKLAGMTSVPGVPYFLLVFAAQMPWQFFSTSLASASQSLVNNSQLISKVYFPRMIIPASAVVTAMVDLLISFWLLAGLMAYFHFWPTWRLLLLPGLVLLAFVSALGPGLLITALNVKYRDFRYVIPYIIQAGFFISPVGYLTSKVAEKYSEKWLLVYSLNPMVGVIDGFRWAILGGRTEVYLPGFFLSLGVAGLLMWFGIWYFRRTERSFADVI
ncbi:MAG: ABC transporter permease [Methylacidiphilales bacterium]|nr:ABC transporter permease [Candidatus Methylacidiphilales bacterium]